MKIGPYILTPTERGTFIIAHESGECAEVYEEALEAMLDEFWEETF